MQGISSTGVQAWINQYLRVAWDGAEGKAHCPLHTDAHESLTVNSDKVVWNCHAGCGGGKLSELAGKCGWPWPFNGQFGGGDRQPPTYYVYQDAAGNETFRKKRYYINGRKCFAMEHRENGHYVKGRAGKPQLYRLPELAVALGRGKPVFVTEGEKDVENLRAWKLVATTNDTGGGEGKWNGAHTQHFPKGARVYLLGDADIPGQAHMQAVGRALTARGCVVKVVDLGYSISQNHGRDVSDWIREGHTREELLGLCRQAETFKTADLEEESEADAAPAGGKESKPKQADLAVQLASGVELFHDDDKAYARILVGDHRETWRLRGREFKTWLRRQFYLTTQTAIGSQALDDALGVLEGKALFEGPQIKTHVRIAGDDKEIYVDLGNPRWQVLKIDAEGWRVLDEAPMHFRRPPGMGELPIPQSGGHLETDLEPFLNMEADDQKLFIACLVNAFRPVGPYPVLCLHGEQGSAKSTAAKIFRGCIDPNMAMLRSTPREERDLLIAGSNGWVVAFDNLSYLPTWVSDALCRVATGAGFGVRELYENDAEVLFQVQRPVVLNGIEDIASRGDLLDRSVLVYMPPIAEHRRLTERMFMAQFDEALPLILGALLDAVSGAVRHLPEVRLDSVPRMADFCFWVAAAESTLGWEPGSFLRIYRQNREDANSLALEANPIVPELVKLLAAGPWAGTATDLHETLSSQVSEGKRKSSAWPKSGRATSASLKRLAPNLRSVGIEVEWDRQPGGTRTRIIRLKVKSSVFASLCVPIVPKSGTQRDDKDDETQLYSLSLNGSEIERGAYEGL